MFVAGADESHGQIRPFPAAPIIQTPVTTPSPPISEHMLIQLQLQRQALILHRLRFQLAVHNRWSLLRGGGYGYGVNPYVMAALYGGYASSGYGGYGGAAYPVASYSYPYANIPSYAYRRSRYEDYDRDREYTVNLIERQKIIEANQLARSLDEPLESEILSGTALNVVLENLKKLTANASAGELPTVYLPSPEATLEHVRVTRGPGSAAVLKQLDDLAWPVAFGGVELDAARIRVTNNLKSAVDQVHLQGKVDADTLKLLTADVGLLRGELKRLTPDLLFEQHVEAKSFVQRLDDAVVALQQPDIQLYFNGKYRLQAQTVFELVQHMTANGLRFAAALPGDEAAYKALHKSLAEYHRSMTAKETQQVKETKGKSDY